MDFSDALHELKNRHKLYREGWQGQGQYVCLQKGYPDGIPINANTAAATGLPAGTMGVFLPYLMFCTSQGNFVPWVASQTDILSRDWEIRE
jgi:Protein of unknown function (DUF2829)